MVFDPQTHLKVIGFKFSNHITILTGRLELQKGLRQ